MIKDLIYKGIQAQLDKASKEENEKTGKLRAGNTGMMTPEGRVIGSCAAGTYLRFLGINVKPVDISKELMFAGGRSNEDLWMASLKESYTGPILCEENIPTCWETENGIKVTGRPDIVLCNENESLKCGIELKQIMSTNACYNILIKKEPNLKHLMQAAHYMWQLGCPFELWYTNRMNFELPDWLKFRPFPKPGESLAENIGYRFYRKGDINNKTGRPRKHKITEEQYLQGIPGGYAEPSKFYPFMQGFLLQLDSSGRLAYKDAMDYRAPWIQTIVNVADIIRFYEYISTLESTGKVPPPALNLTPDGTKMNWKFSDYSDYGDLDPEYCAGQDLNEWVEKIKLKINK